MAETPRSTALLAQVARRLRANAIAQRFYLFAFVLATVYLALLIAVRLLGLVPIILDPLTLLVIPAAAFLLAVLVHRRVKPVYAARHIDRESQTKDLFLNIVLLDSSIGEYQALVIRDAEQRAPTIVADRIAPYSFARPLPVLAGVLLALLVGVVYTPQLDPFGQVAAAQVVDQQREQLEQTKKETAARKAALKKGDPEDKKSEAAEAIEAAQAALKQVKREEQKQNAEKLAELQKSLASQWRKLDPEKLRKLMSNMEADQKFGEANDAKEGEWQKELKEGSTESMQKELEELKKDMEKLLSSTDPKEKQQLAREIKKRLSDMQKFADEKLENKPLAAALERAMKQMEMAQQEGKSMEEMAREAVEAAKESAELAQMELKQVGEMAEDMKNLEKALEVMQLAKRLNDEGMLEGGEGGDFEEYEEMYREMMAGMQGEGDGMGGEGMGRGDVAPEDESLDSGFKNEQAKSQIQAGKTLLTLQGKGINESGEEKTEYREAISEVKQGISEAIVQEQVPPGYHEGIKSYFDALDEGAGGEAKTEGE